MVNTYIYILYTDTPCKLGFANHILYNLNKIHIQDLFHTHEFQQDLPYLPALLRRQQGLIEVLSQLILISGMNSKCGRQWFTRKSIKKLAQIIGGFNSYNTNQRYPSQFYCTLLVGTVSGQNNYVLIFGYLWKTPPRTQQVPSSTPRLLGQSNGSSPTLAIQSAVPEEASKLIETWMSRDGSAGING